MPKVCYIKCHIRRGMFSDELTVHIPTVNAAGQLTTASSIVPKDSVVLEGNKTDRGRLRAYCMTEGERVTSVVLRQATLENGPSLVVPSEEVVHA